MPNSKNSSTSKKSESRTSEFAKTHAKRKAKSDPSKLTIRSGSRAQLTRPRKVASSLRNSRVKRRKSAVANPGGPAYGFSSVFLVLIVVVLLFFPSSSLAFAPKAFDEDEAFFLFEEEKSSSGGLLLRRPAAAPLRRSARRESRPPSMWPRVFRKTGRETASRLSKDVSPSARSVPMRSFEVTVSPTATRAAWRLFRGTASESKDTKTVRRNKALRRTRARAVNGTSPDAYANLLSSGEYRSSHVTLMFSRSQYNTSSANPSDDSVVFSSCFWFWCRPFFEEESSSASSSSSSPAPLKERVVPLRLVRKATSLAEGTSQA
mmetsp:Transcript_9256/g.30092  ORF Transcript_9256/g.30092 Transcript_9256/m.30092 type:complete len:320 (-) Transcript_9256:456-1415(-)